MADNDQDEDDDTAGDLEAKYDGLYTGLVADNKDPLGIGRVTVTIPKICEPSGWARPGSMAGNGSPARGPWHIPKIGARVDVHFLMGDKKVPIWYPAQLGQGEQLTHIANPPRGDKVDPKHAHLVWGWEGERYAIQVDERPGNEYFRIADKLEPENNVEIDSLTGLVQLSGKTGVWIRCIAGEIVMQSLRASWNGRPFNATTTEPI